MEQELIALRAAADSSRLRILCLLKTGELTVSELVLILGQSQPRVSRHLKILVDAGLLIRFREGSWVFHRLNPHSCVHKLVDLIQADDPIYIQDLARLDEIDENRTKKAEQYFAKFAPEWDRLRQLDVDEEQVANEVRNVLPLTRSQKLLDLGTGTGRMLQVLAPNVGEALGVDGSHEMLAVARSNLKRWGLKNCRLQQANILSLPLPTGTFDVVVLHQVLHFLKRPWAAINEALRMLTTEGRLLIVDLAPHTVEDLREDHAHHRLGFADEEIAGRLTELGMSCEVIRHLSKTEHTDRLNVTIWLARRDAPMIHT